MCFFFFFFKQKTAYEMRISDWSSDVVLFRSGVAQGPGRFRVRRGQCRRTDDPRSADAGAARLGLCDGGNWRKEGTEWPFPLDSRSADGTTNFLHGVPHFAVSKIGRAHV